MSSSSVTIGAVTPFTPVPTLLASSSKPLILYPSLKLSDVQSIGTVITNDEGGWLLTSEPDGSDYGWTYGGMTARKFNEYYPSIGIAEITRLKSDPQTINFLRQKIICIYYQDYMAVVARNLSNKDSPKAAYLSAIINIGLGGFLEVYRKVNDTTSFCSAWKDYYFTILRNNPAKITVIHGWINRVWKYVEKS